MRLIGLISLILVLAVTVLAIPAPAQAFSFVPCGTTQNPEPCNLRHLLVLMVRMINYLISMAAIVAIYEVLGCGWWIMVSMGDAEKIQSNKTGLENALVGLAIVVLSFIFMNLLVNGILGSKDAVRKWWDINCLYNITASTNDCPIVTVIEGDVVAGGGGGVPGGGGGSGGGGAGGGGGTPARFGDCTGTACSDMALNICEPQQPAGGCAVSQVNRWTAQITQGVGSNTQICSGVDAVKMLKAIMARESAGSPSAVSSSNPPSLGLFQMKAATAGRFKAVCGVPSSTVIDQAWLLSPVSPSNPGTAAAQACMSAAYLRELSANNVCGCDVRQIAAGYNGGGTGLGACNVSTNCGPSAGTNQCKVCGDPQGSRPTKRWECPWDDNAHTDCNVNRTGNFRETRQYAPWVEWCYVNAF